MENFEAALEGKMEFQAPNFDLFLKACRTTAKALFPNFMFLDTPYNKNEKWDIKDPKRYRYELATMGCRTRVYENIAGEKSSLGRGNLSFTTMNMPRLAIEARIKAESLEESGKKEAIERKAKENIHGKCTCFVRTDCRTIVCTLPVSTYSLGTPVPVHDGE